MKKVVALMLALVLMIGSMSIVVAENSKPMNTLLTNILDKTTSEWFASEDSRSLLAMSLYLDYIVATGSKIDGAVFNKTSFVARDGFSLIALVPHRNDYVGIIYQPMNKEGIYMVLADANVAVAKLTMENMGWKYYENDVNMMSDAFEILGTILKQ